ncbi:hypothetical protein [Myxococcus sp. AB036A]|uniref:hypothetical protein n=1 Tax=Myxococcus sp. AB036A TaxID=2562793 RepID=UPI0011467E15|nr:hypothetical protein [Myxococcus sp. AB036A]
MKETLHGIRMQALEANTNALCFPAILVGKAVERTRMEGRPRPPELQHPEDATFSGFNRY